MENNTIGERLEALRQEMRRAGTDYYLVPTADFHNSEYVSDYFKTREYLCGFTGSNGTLVVGPEEAGLWTDGRYFIQAERELEGTRVTLYRMLEEGVPDIRRYLESRMKEGQTLGFDGRVVDAYFGGLLEESLQKKGIHFAYDGDLAGAVWKDRPALPCGRIMALPGEIAGRSVEEKLALVREKMKKEGADSFLLSRLDDLMWLFNIRGSDVPCNPVALSYGFITLTDATVFLQDAAVDEKAAAYFEARRIRVRGYEEVMPFLKGLPDRAKILIDKKNCSYALYKAVEHCEALDRDNPTELLKAVKNDIELERMREVYLKDSATVTKFVYWLKQTVGKKELTELDAADYLEGLRRETEGFLDLSFPTISGYAENAAMMHYEATAQNHKTLAPEGMLLVDSGGQYMGGTTDVTRTIALGPVTDQMKKHFTAVAGGLLQLADARFLYGCTGRNLDILARQPLWELNMDYKCGTGHGVGYILNVHEGPQNIRWRFTEGMKEAVLEAGMDVTNEPGVYLEGEYGIRTENVMVVQNGEKNGDGQFMYFETLTYVPIDLDLIEPELMTKENRARLNDYHKKVWEKLAPFMTPEEKEWLKEATRPV